jgi:hypothetical protein
MAAELWLSTGLVTQYDEDGFLGVQVEGHGGTEATAGLAYAHHPFGFFGRPLDAADGAGAVFLHFSDGDEVHAVALQDPRDASKIPPHSKGSAGVYNSAGQFLLLDHDQETGTWYVPIDGGIRAHVITVGKDGNGKEIVELSHANGSCVTMLDDAITVAGPGGKGSLWIDADGTINIAGNVKLVGGLDVGGTGAQAMVLAPAFQAWATALAAALNGIAISGPAISAAMTTANATLMAAGQSMAKSAPGL